MLRYRNMITPISGPGMFHKIYGNQLVYLCTNCQFIPDFSPLYPNKYSHFVFITWSILRLPAELKVEKSQNTVHQTRR